MSDKEPCHKNMCISPCLFISWNSGFNPTARGLLNKIIKTCYIPYHKWDFWKQFRKHFLLNIFRCQLEYVKILTSVCILTIWWICSQTRGLLEFFVQQFYNRTLRNKHYSSQLMSDTFVFFLYWNAYFPFSLTVQMCFEEYKTVKKCFKKNKHRCVVIKPQESKIVT